MRVSSRAWWLLDASRAIQRHRRRCQVVHEPEDVLNSALTELVQFPRVLDVLLAGLDEAAWRARPVPGEWAPVEIVCHLRDEEDGGLGARYGVAGEDGRLE